MAGVVGENAGKNARLFESELPEQLQYDFLAGIRVLSALIRAVERTSLNDTVESVTEMQLVSNTD